MYVCIYIYIYTHTCMYISVCDFTSPCGHMSALYCVAACLPTRECTCGTRANAPAAPRVCSLTKWLVTWHARNDARA